MPYVNIFMVYTAGLHFSYISKNNSIEPLHSLDGALEISAPW